MAERHGNGPLPTYSKDFTERLIDKGNSRNEWQGSMRCGHLDMNLLRYAKQVCGQLDGLVVNHLDQVNSGLVCTSYKDFELLMPSYRNLNHQLSLGLGLENVQRKYEAMYPERFLKLLDKEIAPVVIEGYGPTYKDKKMKRELSFRSVRKELCQ